MGNSFGCSATGERLVSAARDGDFVEAKMLLDCNPCLAKYSTFGGLNSPLHFAAAKAHNEIVSLLLENGADVNSRNYCGQTALMQACRYGHWEVVQTLLLFRCNVTRADYLSGRTALHFAAVNGHARCIRLVVADFVPSAPFESINAQLNRDRGDNASARSKQDHRGFLKSHVDNFYPEGKHRSPKTYFIFDNRIISSLSKFVNKAADGGVAALHMAALNGYFDCVQLLVDLYANVSAVTFHYGTSMDLIGAGSTPLHYAACGGNLKCCQILLARGASRLTLNCNGWLPLDVARMWGRHWLEPLLAPNSESSVPSFPPSNYLSLPLMSVLNIARDCGLQSSASYSDDTDICAVCLERSCSVAAEGIWEFQIAIMRRPPQLINKNRPNGWDEGMQQNSVCGQLISDKGVFFDISCGHELCVRCALYLCSTSNIPSELFGPPGSIPCPLCRHGIVSFIKLPGSPAKVMKSHIPLSFCTPCMLHPREPDPQTPACTPDIQKNCMASVSSELFCPVSCSPFPSVALPSCTCNDGQCQSLEPREGETQVQSLDHSQPGSVDEDKIEGMRLEKTSCSSMFWWRRSCSRENQCNAEINA